MTENVLYYGDNLDILRRYVADESVDLVYLDPPFNSAQDYNVLFAEQDGTRSAAQIKAFGDTWRWDQASATAYHETVEQGPERVAKAMQAFRTMLGENDMLAYLAMMAPRLVELHRVLRPTGTIYLHCDSTAGHYLKLLLDSIFGYANLQGQIVWQRTATHNDAKRWPELADIIFVYSRSHRFSWVPQYRAQSAADILQRYRHTDPDGRRYRLGPMDAPAGGGMAAINKKTGKPNGWYVWKGYQPPEKGWRYSPETMQRPHDEGRINYPKDKTKRLARKLYLDESKGALLGNVWTDIPPLQASSAERLGYPTQKPEALLERIIRASSHEGDVVLDPFCGCGTAIAVAQRLKRRWLGIDITHLAINLIRHRLKDAFGERVEKTYRVEGEPTDLAGAKALAAQDRFQFQCWALGLVGARKTEVRKGADRGIDGRLYFHDDNGKTKQVIFSVKSGKVSVKDLRDLRGVVEREEAALGVFVTLEEATRPMRTEAAAAGFYLSPWTQKNHPRLQVLTVEQLLAGQRVEMPPVRHTNVTFKKAPKATGQKKRSTKRRQSNGPSMFA